MHEEMTVKETLPFKGPHGGGTMRARAGRMVVIAGVVALVLRASGLLGAEQPGGMREHGMAGGGEATINPNAVLTEGPGFVGPDGKSRMPSYTDSMTLQQLIDVVAYLRTLRAAPPAPAGTHGQGQGAPGGGHTMPH
jgi:hypothetical protein